MLIGKNDQMLFSGKELYIIDKWVSARKLLLVMIITVIKCKSDILPTLKRLPSQSIPH